MIEEVLNNQTEITQVEKLTKDQKYYRRKKAKEKEMQEQLEKYSFLYKLLLGLVAGLIFCIWRKEGNEEKEKHTFPSPYIYTR